MPFRQGRGLFEAVRPQRLVFEAGGRDLDASFFVAGRFGSRRLCLSRWRKGRASTVVGPLCDRAEREAGNSYHDRFDVGIHADRINDSVPFPPSYAGFLFSTAHLTWQASHAASMSPPAFDNASGILRVDRLQGGERRVLQTMGQHDP